MWRSAARRRDDSRLLNGDSGQLNGDSAPYNDDSETRDDDSACSGPLNGELEVLATLEGHESEVKCVAWNCSSQLLATSGRDKSIWIWESTSRFYLANRLTKFGHNLIDMYEKVNRIVRKNRIKFSVCVTVLLRCV